MPSALLKDASSTMLQDHSREMGNATAGHTKKATEIRNHDEIASSERKKPHKQSFDYIWRTGLAGGLAGSAVCYSLSNWVVLFLYLTRNRPKRWWRRWIVSKSSFKQAVRNSRNIQDPGLAL